MKRYIVSIAIIVSALILAGTMMSCTKTIRISIQQYRYIQNELYILKSYYVTTESFLDEISETTDICSGSDVHSDYEDARYAASRYIDEDFIDYMNDRE